MIFVRAIVAIGIVVFGFVIYPYYVEDVIEPLIDIAQSISQSTQPEEMFENYNTGSDTAHSAGGTDWLFQTFTPEVSHNVSKVKLLLYSAIGGTTVTVGIWSTDDGEPDSLLTSGTFDRSELTENITGEWREIAMTPYSLQADIPYAIVLSTDGELGEWVNWLADDSSPTYSGGSAGYSDDGGETWIVEDMTDFMFEEYGKGAGENVLEEAYFSLLPLIILLMILYFGVMTLLGKAGIGVRREP